SKRQGTSPYDGSRAELEEDGDPPGSPEETGVSPLFLQRPEPYDKEKETHVSKRRGFSTI
ncbi:hypothetical protein UY416_09955, partial [Paenibacillus polymyxa]|uniref:hypothetical protein n=1 Tax=Paenibacillus polymyxa TaxID=1406 RepID=UPI002AB53D6A